MTAAVEIRGLCKLYGRHRALWNLNLDVEAGEGLGLLGPNGAGKTTLLWILSTLSRPSRGDVRFRGFERPIDARGKIAFVSHESMTYDDLTGRENLELVARCTGRPIGEAKTWLERMGLGAAADRSAKTYSRGMRQRLSLARAFMIEPSIVLLDEPFTGLDQHSAAEIESLLELLRGSGATLWLVTHELERAARLCTRYAFLAQGRLVREAAGPMETQALRQTYVDALEGRA
ncbi:MAG: ABC transporter ATP-binding protein [Myxococcota bacterium]